MDAGIHWPVFCTIPLNYSSLYDSLIVDMAKQTTYQYNKKARVPFKTGSGIIGIDADIFYRATIRADEIIAKIQNFEVDIFKILGMRNLSAFIGEVYANALAIESDGLFIQNPHQDGYPDLLVMTKEGKAEYTRLKNNLRDKRPFSPFVPGGLEVKATVGSVPSPSVLRPRGIEKPDIGDTRIDLLTGYDWKAHHRETNNLIGILWDFIDRKPTIVALFYSNELLEQDWGKIIQPRDGGGRTTSVSIMQRSGIKKMYDGWLAVINDDQYVNFLNRRNRADLIPVPSDV
jgi:hypothetical protein